MKSKAILEFDYPEDYNELRWALHGKIAINALHAIRSVAVKHLRTNGMREIVELINTALVECQEEKQDDVSTRN
jgi:hypothetical protein